VDSAKINDAFLTIELPHELREAAAKEAARRGRTTSQPTRQLLQDLLAEVAPARTTKNLHAKRAAKAARARARKASPTPGRPLKPKKKGAS
jgi:hypothetical protein